MIQMEESAEECCPLDGKYLNKLERLIAQGFIGPDIEKLEVIHHSFCDTVTGLSHTCNCDVTIKYDGRVIKEASA